MKIGRPSRHEQEQLTAEIKILMEQGKNISEIASIVGVQRKTVARHIQGIKEAQIASQAVSSKDLEQDLKSVRLKIQSELSSKSPNHILLRTLFKQQDRLLERISLNHVEQQEEPQMFNWLPSHLQKEAEKELCDTVSNLINRWHSVYLELRSDNYENDQSRTANEIS